MRRRRSTQKKVRLFGGQNMMASKVPSTLRNPNEATPSSDSTCHILKSRRHQKENLFAFALATNLPKVAFLTEQVRDALVGSDNGKKQRTIEWFDPLNGFDPPFFPVQAQFCLDHCRKRTTDVAKIFSAWWHKKLKDAPIRGNFAESWASSEKISTRSVPFSRKIIRNVE